MSISPPTPAQSFNYPGRSLTLCKPGERVVRARARKYNVISNNCQAFTLDLLEKICQPDNKRDKRRRN